MTNSIGHSPSLPMTIPHVNSQQYFENIVMPLSQQPPPYTTMTTTAKKPCVEMSDEQVNEIVDMLGTILVKVKKEIQDKKDTYAPSAAVAFLLRRMNVIEEQQQQQDDTQQHDLYCLMTGFMTVYVSFIQEVFLHQFKDFMRLFSTHDSILNDTNNPFLWLYLSYDKTNNLSILNELHLQLLPKRYDADFILSRIDAIFSKFYTTHFLEAYVQNHQKDHGQFYTPQPIIQFMWDKCANLPTLIQHLQEKSTMLRVFDPCLGMGSFLCEFLTRFIKACRFTIWHDPVRLTQLLAHKIPDHIWGVEIDPFAYQLSKINMMIHLFPLYERLKELGVDLRPGMINRLRLFCNDSLKLRQDTNPLVSDTAILDPFEKACLDALRNATQKFDYIVTNPPYMIRKTGYVAQPDPMIYDEDILGGKGSQAYLYFMWMALKRCDDATGQICLITPSQWTVLEFAQHIREWIWQNCKLLDVYEFEPFKVWPKVQTDSLIFRICKRTTTLFNTNHTLYVRNTSRKITLTGLLELYKHFDPNNSSTMNADIKYKYTPLDDSNSILTSKHASFAFVLPAASCLEELNSLTAHLPRLCDGEQNKGTDVTAMARAAAAAARTTEDEYQYITPLNWNRGPNTNPVYSLVVRTSWARATFGQEACDRYLRPCFYWNGKTISSSTGGGKEGEFWKERDPLRLGKKEMSAAEAYWPFCNLDTAEPTVPFYSMILVNKDEAEKMKQEFDQHGENSPFAALYDYLRQARVALQGDKKEKEIAHCQYNKCGVEVPVKIIHPINCGYYTKSQPRQRFFVDRTRVAVTNQCIYFTVKPNYPWQDADYYCGLLNSSLLQFYSKVHCSYDQQGRMRFFGRLMAYIPFAPPPSMTFMQQVATLVQGITEVRTWLYSLIRHTINGTRLMERVRNCEWRLSPQDVLLLRQFISPPKDQLQPDTSLSTFTCPAYLSWITQIVTREDALAHGDGIEHVFTTLLKINSLFQFAIDQMVYHVYSVPIHLQLDVEKDLSLQGLRKEWEDQHDLIYTGQEEEEDWFQHIMQVAQSFTTTLNVTQISVAPTPPSTNDYSHTSTPMTMTSSSHGIDQDNVDVTQPAQYAENSYTTSATIQFDSHMPISVAKSHSDQCAANTTPTTPFNDPTTPICDAPPHVFYNIYYPTTTPIHMTSQSNTAVALENNTDI